MIQKKPGPKNPKGFKRRSIAMSDDQWDLIGKYADKWGWSRSEVVRYFVFEASESFALEEDPELSD
jgi:hypothetical protein